MVADGFVLAEDLALSMIALSTLVWSQKPGQRAEPVSRAWKRLFKKPITIPVAFMSCTFEGRPVVVRLHPLGRLEVVDPHQGSSIRTVNWRAVEAAENIGRRLGAFDPMAAHFQSNGRPVGSGSDTQHHGRVAGATVNFLKH